jgi:hypothetical protein
MGMGSPDNRRKADGSYQALSGWQGFLCPSLRDGNRMSQRRTQMKHSLIVFLAGGAISMGPQSCRPSLGANARQRPLMIILGLIIAWWSVAQIWFPGAGGMVFNFPGLWRGARARGQSLGGIGSCRQKSRPGLWPHQTVSRRELAAPTKTGSTVDRERFDSEEVGCGPVLRGHPRA